MTASYFQLARFRVMWRGKAVYDQKFHAGLNIIRGLNSSGKSTIADFIFYSLGGEVENWKGAAKRCEEVQAELITRDGTITIRRQIGGRVTPPFLFFGSMEEASSHGLDSWTGHPLHRTGSQESFSQIVFRASGIPEAPNGDSNITMHQIMRLAYSDQKTPAGKLFRFENFDTSDIREAVGDLVCGLSIYESYSLRLRLRELRDLYEIKDRELTLKIAAMPSKLAGVNLESLEFQIQELIDARSQLASEISGVDKLVPEHADKKFLSDRQSAVSRLNAAARAIRKVETKIEKLSYELSDIERYNDFLRNLLEKLSHAETTAEIVGPIEFTHCPSCLSKLKTPDDASHCSVCGSSQGPEVARSKYLQIKLDFQIQLRESTQLLAAKLLDLDAARSDQRKERVEYDSLLIELSTRYDSSSSPREGFLAERHQRIGKIDNEISYLQSLIEIATEISRLGTEKAAINDEMERAKTRLNALTRNGEKRKKEALTLISSLGCKILAKDLKRQEEFFSPKSLLLNFRDDAIVVDDNMNFSESSNVILKNTAILSLFAAAVVNQNFNHPRFLLLDNVEDKGMEEIRSHNFQKIIAETSESSPFPHQIIFTTSMMNPALEHEKYVIGPAYTREKKTLDLPDDSSIDRI